MGLTEKDLRRLSPSARRQVMAQMGKNARETKTKKPNKYSAEKCTVTLVGGKVMKFDSKKEAERAFELSVLVSQGMIRNLRFQVPFELVPAQTRPDGTKEQPVRYIADFVYEVPRLYWKGYEKHCPDGEYTTVVEDVKGYKDPSSPAYKLYTVKRKLMLYVHGIMVREV